MKDFFDIYYLSNIFDFSGSTLEEAVRITTKHRGRVLEKDTFERIRAFADDSFLKAQWQRFEPAKAIGVEFTEILQQLERFLGPVYQAVLQDDDFNLQWSSSQKSWI